MKKRLIYIFVILAVGLVVISSCDSVKANPVRAFGNSCSDSDYGFIYNDLGTVTLTGGRGERQNTDYCRDENTLIEYGCTERYGGFIAGSNRVNCAEKFGEGSTCQNGACVGGEELVLECGTIIDENFWNRKVTMEEDIICNQEPQVDTKWAISKNTNGDNFVIDCNGHDIILPERNQEDIWARNFGGIFISNTFGDTKNGAIKNCHITGFNNYGLKLANIKNFEISDNIITETRGVEIAGMRSSNNKILRNEIIDSSDYGLVLVSINSNIIDSNTMRNSQFEGLHVYGDVMNNVINNNNICFNGDNDILCRQGSENEYSGNVCDNIEDNCNNNIRCVNRCE